MRRLLLLAVLALGGTAVARDSLGVFDTWGAFRDPAVPRCYAIAMADKVAAREQTFQPFLTIGYWPKRGIRGAVHVRLARRLAPGSSVNVSFPDSNFTLQAGQADAWPSDQRTNAAIVAQLRSAPRVVVTAQGSNGRKFRDSYTLGGVASAMDAAALGCKG